MKNTKYKRINTKYKSGFSIIELMVYISVFTFISILVINMFISVSSAFVEIKSNHELARSGSALLEKMTREIKWANTIDASSTLGTAPSTLILNGTNSSGIARSVTFSVINGKVNFTEDAVDSGSLLTSSVTVDSFLVREITTTTSSAVKIEATLTFTRANSSRTETFYSTVALRGGY
jgi:Tfp pilus assembly protein PilW